MKAKRAEITIAGHKVEVFQLPNGEYVMSQTQVAEAIDKTESNFRRFLASEPLECLPGNALNFVGMPTGGRGRPIKVVPTTVVSAYWVKQALAGNKLAQALTYACVQETLERRADAAFNAIKAEAQYEARTAFSYDQWVKSRTFSKCSHELLVNN